MTCGAPLDRDDPQAARCELPDRHPGDHCRGLLLWAAEPCGWSMWNTDTEQAVTCGRHAGHTGDHQA